MDGNHMFYNTFEGSGSPSGHVWIPSLLTWRKNNMCLHMLRVTSSPSARNQFFKTLLKHLVPSVDAFGILCLLICLEIQCFATLRATLSLYEWKPHVLRYFWSLWYLERTCLETFFPGGQEIQCFGTHLEATVNPHQVPHAQKPYVLRHC